MPRGYRTVKGKLTPIVPVYVYQEVKADAYVHPLIHTITERQNQLKMSTPMLAKKAGVHVYSIRAWRRGAWPRIHSLFCVCEVLGLELIVQPKQKPSQEPSRAPQTAYPVGSATTLPEHTSRPS